MSTKKGNEVSGAKVRRSSGRGRNKSMTVASDVINTSAVADVVSAPSGAGLSDGTSTSISSLSSPAVGGGVTSSKGRSNGSSQLDAAVIREVSSDDEKEERLYNKIVRNFLAPEFDKNAFAANMIAKGMDFTEILAKVNEGRKEWEKNHPAPDCNVAKVLALCVSDFSKEFKDLVGTNPSDIKVSDVRVYSRPAGVLVARPLSSDASASAIVRSVLSYRHKVVDDAYQAQMKYKTRSSYYNGLSSAARGGLDLNLSDDVILNDFRQSLERARHDYDTETAQLRKNFLKYRAALDVAIADVVDLCPSVVIARYDGREYDVLTVPENITKEQKSVCGAQFAKIRNLRRNLTAINARLWRVDVVL